jgi:metallo-beta-lactamase class B
MKTYRVGTASAVMMALGLGVAGAMAQSAASRVETHVAAAKAAAGAEFAGVFDRICAEAVPPATPRPPAAPRPPGPPPRESWHAEPVKVFDNLYFLGQTEYSVWAVTTSAGVILIDAIFDYSVDDEVVGGMKKLGLDPATIKYVIVSHGHSDHSGGAKYLQDRFNARVILGAADWDLLDKSTQTRPRRDMVATDGQKLTLGDTTLTLYLTPGHTPGTISTLVPVKDGGRTHLAAAWGGTAFNFPRTPENFKVYVNSADRFRDIVAKAGADVIIANHTRFDGTPKKVAALATRKPGQAHPYVIGKTAAANYVTVAGECARAALLSLTK